MTDGKPGVTVADIRHVVDQIVERFHPAKIWLFGSFAYGTPTPDSDVDLLIAMDTALRNVQQAVEIRKAVAFPFPVDVLVRTPQQIAERLALGDVFFHEVLTKGIVLHEPLTQEWGQKAEGDYTVVATLWQAESAVYDAICFHAQQCIEKYLKAW